MAACYTGIHIPSFLSTFSKYSAQRKMMGNGNSHNNKKITFKQNITNASHSALNSLGNRLRRTLSGTANHNLAAILMYLILVLVHSFMWLILFSADSFMYLIFIFTNAPIRRCQLIAHLCAIKLIKFPSLSLPAALCSFVSKLPVSMSMRSLDAGSKVNA